MKFFLRPLVKAEECDPKKGTHALCAICKGSAVEGKPLFKVSSPMAPEFIAHRDCVNLEVKP